MTTQAHLSRAKGVEMTRGEHKLKACSFSGFTFTSTAKGVDD